MTLLHPYFYRFLLYIPSIFIYFVIIWILFPSKVNKKLFLVLSIILFGLLLFYIFKFSDISWIYNGYTYIPFTKMQIVNRFFVWLLDIFSFFPHISMLGLPIIIVLGSIYYKKTKDKLFLKKSSFILIIIAFIFYLYFPFVYYDVFHSLNIKNKNLIKMYQFAADKSFINGIKGFLSEHTAFSITIEIDEKINYNSKNLSSPEVQKLIDEYIKYQKQAANLIGYDNYIYLSNSCDTYKRYDDALKYAYIAKSYGADIDDSIVHLYNQKKEFNKALDIINTGAKVRSNTKIRTYIGLKDYEKALEECNKTNNTIYLYYKSYIYYKKGNRELAVKIFDEYKALYKYRSKKSFDEFIEDMNKLF